jgi:hypothetical protein
MLIAALFVETNGCYFGLDGVEPWDITRDAKKYAGPHPVVAHPPCQLWTRFAHVNFARWGGEHNRPGNDDGCFESALANLRRCGGVLEHPAFSDAWKAYDLPRPAKSAQGWQFSGDLAVCEVWQSAYGHKARKRTWLLYHGRNRPADLLWDRKDGTHQIGFHDQRGRDRNKPTVSGKKASATPSGFRDALISLARNSGHG